MFFFVFLCNYFIANSKATLCQAFDISKGDIGFERQTCGEVWRSVEKWHFEHLWCVHVQRFRARQHSHESDNGEALDGQSFKDSISSIFELCKDI